jgi:hypothetical protein
MSAAAIDVDPIAWLQMLALAGELVRAEPNVLRHRILHTAPSSPRTTRRWLRLPRTWPSAQAVADAFTRITAVPAAPG